MSSFILHHSFPSSFPSSLYSAPCPFLFSSALMFTMLLLSYESLQMKPSLPECFSLPSLLVNLYLDSLSDLFVSHPSSIYFYYIMCFFICNTYLSCNFILFFYMIDLSIEAYILYSTIIFTKVGMFSGISNLCFSTY